MAPLALPGYAYGVMGRNVRGYPGLFSPNRATSNRNRSFRNESDRTRLSKLQKITIKR